MTSLRVFYFSFFSIKHFSWPQSRWLSASGQVHSTLRFVYTCVQADKKPLFVWARGPFSNLLHNLHVTVIISLKEWLNGQQIRDRDEFFLSSFFSNKALACPLCGLQCWIKTCFHLSPSFSTSTSPPPTQCQVVLWDTQWSARVCCFACVCAVQWLSFWQAAVLKHLSGKLDYYWTTEEHSYLTVKYIGFFLLSLPLPTHTHIDTLTHNVGCFANSAPPVHRMTGKNPANPVKNPGFCLFVCLNKTTNTYLDTADFPKVLCTYLCSQAGIQSNISLC